MIKNQCKIFLVIFLKSIFLKIFLKFKNWNKKINVNIFGNYIFKNAKNILKILQTEVKTIVCSSLMLILYSPYSVHGSNSDSLDYFIHWYALFFDCPARDNEYDWKFAYTFLFDIWKCFRFSKNELECFYSASLIIST